MRVAGQAFLSVWWSIVRLPPSRSEDPAAGRERRYFGAEAFPIPVRLVYLLVLALLLAACGRGSGAGEAPNTPGSASPQSGKQKDEKLSDSRPEGLFQVHPSAPPPHCDATLSAGLTLQDSIPLERFRTKSVCFKGFEGHASKLRIIVTTPDGKQELTDTDQRLDDMGVWLWEIEAPTLGMPLGTYKFRATQRLSRSITTPTTSTAPTANLLEANGSFRVVLATTPRIREASLPGPILKAEFAGFPSNARVSIFLYRSNRQRQGPDYIFVKRLPSAQIDSKGEAFYSWTFTSHDPSRGYAIWTNPTPDYCSGTLPQPCATFYI